MRLNVSSKVLVDRYPMIEKYLPEGQGDFKKQIDFAYEEVKDDLRLKGFEAAQIPDETKTIDRLVEKKAISLIYFTASRQSNDHFWDMAKKYEDDYKEILAAAKFPYDIDESGQISDDEENVNPNIRFVR